jgi:2'-5' RNA ligase
MDQTVHLRERKRMHRLFVALHPPPPVMQACLEAMEDGPPGWAWQDEEQLHLTLRYIGEVERPLAEDIAAVLQTVRSRPVELGLSGVGFFDQGPRGALFARAAPREPLEALHKKIDRALVALGLKPEGRAYLPHITLARRRRSAVDPAIWLRRHAALSSPVVECPAFALYESHLGRDGSIYDEVSRIPFLSG